MSYRIKWIGGDFVPIPGSDLVFQTFEKAIVVNCKAGDLCLWDSRTIQKKKL